MNAVGYVLRTALRRSDRDGDGWSRRRHGTGFTYIDENGRRLSAQDAGRCRSLVIPPAWNDVWISPDPEGHIQDAGVDEAGRKQYIYHPTWTNRRGRLKFARVRTVGEALPRLRRRVGKDLNTGLTRRRVLALGARLLDLGLFRVGGDA